MSKHGPCESGPSAWRALSMELTDYQRFECWTDDPRMQGPRSALTFGAYRLQLTVTPSLRTFDELQIDQPLCRTIRLRIDQIRTFENDFG
jgi:hypothetical protein